MKEQNAFKLLAKVMDWNEEEVRNYLPTLTLLADYKYDHYQQFSPGKRFIESLALWLQRFDMKERIIALKFVFDRLIYISDPEFSHLVQIAYPDLIVHERMRMVAEEQGILKHQIGRITQHPRFDELRLKSMYLGLSDGARTNELRRSSDGEISNDQIWQAYELGDDKAKEMLEELRKSVSSPNKSPAQFNIVWLIDDFSGSGHSYIRYDYNEGKYKGKIKKIYERLHKIELVNKTHHEIYLLLYLATRQAIDHIEYWSERFTSDNGYKPLHVKVICTLEYETNLARNWDLNLKNLIENSNYYDARSHDKHFAVGGTENAKLGFAKCALPVALSHNTPNNSVYILWGPENLDFPGLFPRVSRHREF